MGIIPITGIDPITSILEKELDQSKGTVAIPFSNVLKDAIDDYREVQQETKKDSYELAMGTSDDVAGMMIRSTKEAAAIEMAVQLTSRAVNAYKEIMQMQV